MTINLEENTIKYKLEQREIDTLSEFATKSRFSLGRKKQEDECPLRTSFQRDRKISTSGKWNFLRRTENLQLLQDTSETES